MAGVVDPCWRKPGFVSCDIFLAPMPEQRGRPGPHPGGSKAVRHSAIIAAVHTGANVKTGLV
jgi:hypothetical protein